jgi:hypothetical protein
MRLLFSAAIQARYEQAKPGGRHTAASDSVGKESHMAGRSSLCLVVFCASVGVGCTGDGNHDEEPERCFETTLANCGAGPWDPFGIALAFAWWGGQCTEEVACTAEPIQTDIEAGIVTDTFIRENWTSNSLSEREPNNSDSEAMPLLIQDDGSVLITGSVNDATDPADYFVFATESFDLHALYVCRTVNDCTLPFYQGDALYIELLDENGVPLDSTAFAQTNNGHEIVYTPSPGLRYFAVVHAQDTGGVDFQYKLVLTD